MRFKFRIDPATETGRDTICQNLRYLHRRLSASGDTEGVRLVEKCFDFGKRMNAKLQQNKRALNISGPAIKDGHPDEDD
jgi:hypothetical protein